MATNTGTLIAGPVRPIDSADVYPSFHANEGKGGYHVVADNTARDAITTARRIEGMLVYVTGTGLFWRLGSDLTSWVAYPADASIANANLASVATATFKGRLTAGTGAPEDLNVTQATSLLNTFTTSAKGLVPAASGGSETTQFLRKDGTFAVPSSTSSAAGLTEIYVSDAGSDSNSGTAASPFATVVAAYAYAKTISPSVTAPKTIRVAAGRYSVASLTMDTDYIHLRGDGIGSTVLSFAGAASGITRSAGNSTLSNLTLISSGGNIGPLYHESNAAAATAKVRDVEMINPDGQAIGTLYGDAFNLLLNSDINVNFLYGGNLYSSDMYGETWNVKEAVVYPATAPLDVDTNTGRTPHIIGCKMWVTATNGVNIFGATDFSPLQSGVAGDSGHWTGRATNIMSCYLFSQHGAGNTGACLMGVARVYSCELYGETILRKYHDSYMVGCILNGQSKLSAFARDYCTSVGFDNCTFVNEGHRGFIGTISTIRWNQCHFEQSMYSVLGPELIEHAVLCTDYYNKIDGVNGQYTANKHARLRVMDPRPTVNAGTATPLPATPSGYFPISVRNGLTGANEQKMVPYFEPRWLALSFDGVNDYVTTPHSTLFFSVAAMQVEFRIRMDAAHVSETAGLIGAGVVNVSGWRIILSGHQLVMQVVTNGPTPTGVVAHTSGSGTGNLNDGLIHHIVMTWDRQYITIFKDGVLTAQAAAVGQNVYDPGAGTGMFRIGNIGNDGDYPNVEISDLLFQSNGKTVVHWTMEEGTGATVYDRSVGNTNQDGGDTASNGTITGATWLT